MTEHATTPISDTAIGRNLHLSRNTNRRLIRGMILHLWWSATTRQRVSATEHCLRPPTHVGRREAFVEEAAMWREMDRL